ncbi:MAG: DUF1589 domain-containing protein [Rhodopirellula sp. JB055]|uniref:DUF1589 domain-containing protein n=1 Tax=Rhodopirellula sp. JB055 TaxID=3342846 RepID=UPI00370BAABD
MELALQTPDDSLCSKASARLPGTTWPTNLKHDAPEFHHNTTHQRPSQPDASARDTPQFRACHQRRPLATLATSEFLANPATECHDATVSRNGS